MSQGWMGNISHKCVLKSVIKIIPQVTTQFYNSGNIPWSCKTELLINALNNDNYTITAITPPAACIANKSCHQGIKASLSFSFLYLKNDARVLSSHMLIFSWKYALILHYNFK